MAEAQAEPEGRVTVEPVHPTVASSHSSNMISQGRQSLVEHLADEEDMNVYALLMPEEYTMKEGAPLWSGVRLGKFLGAGAQAKVFQLTRDDGTKLGKVIKVNHGDIGSKLLNNNVLWVGMDREWEVGTQLRAALQEPGGAVPGFMKVCDCLIVRRGNRAAFAGMLMEELHGFEIYKRIDRPEFHNIHYVREMLYQTFSALDRAQRKIGFFHADLGMRNVMEHYPRTWDQLPKEVGEAAKAEALKRPGYTCNSDGSRLPLGPEIEFKIIDFGVAKFSSKLAAGAAGAEAEEVVEKLQEQFGERERIKFSSEKSEATIEFETSDVTKDWSRMDKLRSWLKIPGKNKLTVVLKPVKPMGRVAHRALSSMASRVPGRAHVAAPGGDVEEALKEEESDWDAHRLSTFGNVGFTAAAKQVNDERKDMQSKPRRNRRRKRKSPIETMYRHFWHRKGDVFHLLLNMALVLDDRCWPEEDIEEVAGLCSLIHHVTGVKLAVHFADGAPGDDKTFGRHKWQHWFRRWHIRLKGHLLPFNSGLLAREALSHPFFGVTQASVKHASLPAPLTTVFPSE